MTESTTPLKSPQNNESATIISTDQGATKKPVSKAAKTQQSSSTTSTNKISKLAIFAVLIALAAPAAHYYWQQLQIQQLSQTLSQQISAGNKAALSRYQTKMQQALTTQQQNFDQQLQQVITTIEGTSQAKIAALDTSLTHLEQSIKQRQPSDWLLHEAEYLIRVAARSLWLEYDAAAAIGLLNDANKRLAELNDPEFLPVQAVIFQDIKSLELMPTLQTDEIVLTLMAINKQVAQLPLAIVDVDKKNNAENDLALSNNISDWQTNLAKTWQKFFNDFIRIRSRTGNIEPLMSPDQQANLKQNLSLKIQLALWAASERKGDVYRQSLTDIQQWLTEFFDMQDAANQHFAKTLQDLQNKQVSFNYPNELNALKAIRLIMNNESTSIPAAPKKDTDKRENETQTNEAKALKTEPKKPTPQPKNQPEQSKSEGSI